MIKNINIRFNLDREEHRKAWDYMQTMDRTVEKTYSKVIIKSLIRYFERTDAENSAETESYWQRFRSEMESVMKGKTVPVSTETEKIAKRIIFCRKLVRMCWMLWKICFSGKVTERLAVLAEFLINRESRMIVAVYLPFPLVWKQGRKVLFAAIAQCK